MGMSIDEAINHLGNYSSTNGSGLTTDKQHNEAKRVAIETMRKYQKLEQEPTTKNDLGVTSELEKNSKKLEKNFGESDCISRAEVLKLMKDNWHTHNGDWAMQESMDDIRALPAVTPQEPRKGHWIKQTLSVKPFGEDTVLCDQCAFMTDKDNTYNFCPNCGAKMVEPQESEDNNGFN